MNNRSSQTDGQTSWNVEAALHCSKIYGAEEEALFSPQHPQHSPRLSVISLLEDLTPSIGTRQPCGTQTYMEANPHTHKRENTNQSALVSLEDEKQIDQMVSTTATPTNQESLLKCFPGMTL